MNNFNFINKEKKEIKVAVGVLIFYQGKVLLCKSTKKWSNKWSIPGGKMFFGESIEETVKREVVEETGLEIEIKSINRAKSVINPPEFEKKGEHFLMIDVVAESKSEKVKLNKEFSEYKWVYPKEALTMDTLIYTKEPIEEYLQREKQEDYLAGWQRCKADFTNYQNKTEQFFKEVRERTQVDLILTILPILDNFNLAKQHVPKEEEKKSWVIGLFYTQKQFEDILNSLGVFEMQALGQKFDPNYHESVGEVLVKDEKQKDCVVEVVQKGYQMKDKILRPAKVKIGK